jgi:hypothetical protein
MHKCSSCVVRHPFVCTEVEYDVLYALKQKNEIAMKYRLCCVVY